MDFDGRRLVDPQHLVGIEVGLLDTPVLERDLAMERRRDAENDRALELGADGVRIDGGAAVSSGLVIAPISLSLHRLIQLRQLSGHPVLLAEDGVISGVCDENEIVRALAGKTARSS